MEPEPILPSTNEAVSEQIGHGKSDSNTGRTLTETPTDIKPILCEPCKSQQKHEIAYQFCPECDELLCISCSDTHKVLKATRSHVLVDSDKYVLKHNSAQEAFSQNLLAKEISDPGANQQDAFILQKPGRPNAIYIGTESITINWLKPDVFNTEGCYQISYKKHTHDSIWRVYDKKFKHNTAILTKLDTDCEYVFRIRVVCGEIEGQNSDVSDVIKTLPSAASRLLAFSLPHDKSNTSPKIYAIQTKEISDARNTTARTRHLEVGSRKSDTNTEKTIMMIGETGTGKSTIVDGMVNYIFGVNWSDNFRFTIVNLEDKESSKNNNQGVSQTEWITCYTIHQDVGNRIPYTLNIIDTPGFGDCRGIDRDKAIENQLKELFEALPPNGILTIDAICLLVKATDSQRTAIQTYIFESIMSIFGKDVEKNICKLVTFFDGVNPAVCAALDESKIAFGKRFTFNNLGPYSQNTYLDEYCLAPIFWDMGITSFMHFFKHLGTLKSISLQLTKNVLNERSRLEAMISNFPPNFEAGLVNVNKVEELILNLGKIKEIIKGNEHFTYNVTQIVRKQEPLPRGRNVTNCLNCAFTCHENCGRADDHEKRYCSAMDERGYCKNCPDKCIWTKHANTPYIIKYVTVIEQRVNEKMKYDYQKAYMEMMNKNEQLVCMKNKLKDQIKTVDEMVRTLVDCYDTLDSINLRPNPLNFADCINEMIAFEEMKIKLGCDRIKSLEDAKERAKILQEAKNALDASSSHVNSNAIKDLFERSKRVL